MTGSEDGSSFKPLLTDFLYIGLYYLKLYWFDDVQ